MIRLNMKSLIKICLWVLAFVPLIVDYNVFYPFTSGKNLLIESAIFLSGVLLLINFFYSRGFREEVIEKVIKYSQHPLVLSVLAFISVFIISTVFAVDKYGAFWGELSRAEGLAGMMFFLSFFVFSLLVFEYKDWLSFFKLSLFTGLILLSKEFVEYFVYDLARPGSYTGNPTFLAGYLIYSITSALIVLSNYNSELVSKKNSNIGARFWRYFSYIIIILSVLGIFIAETRGAILGLFVGIIAILFYFAIKGKNVIYKKVSLRQVSIVLICAGIIFSGVFVLTRKSEIWQRVPGLSRLTEISSKQDSTAVRLYVYKASLNAVNPIKNGWKKLLIGWGPDNFIFVDSKYYDPIVYKYETEWHDRAHNKFLDVLVMEGIFGLFAYLAIWFFFFKTFFKRSVLLKPSESEISVARVSVLFFGTAFLTHLLFVFDQISSSIPFFMILAFVVYYTAQEPIKVSKKSEISPETEDKKEIITGTFLVILVVFIAFVYFKNTLPGYIQMRNYTSLVNNSQINRFEKGIDSIFTPFTSAQENIRRDFMKITNSLYHEKPTEVNFRLVEKAITKAEEYVIARPLDFQFQTTLADLYSRKGNSLKNTEYLKRGEELIRQVLVFAPNRPDMNHKLALNLIYQKRYEESFVLYEKIFKTHLTVLDQDRDEFEGIYTSLVKYFYEQKDKESFIKVVDRLRDNNYIDSSSLRKILDYLNKTDTWPKVNFE